MQIELQIEGSGRGCSRYENFKLKEYEISAGLRKVYCIETHKEENATFKESE